MAHDGFIKSDEAWTGARSCPYCARFSEDGHAKDCPFIERYRAGLEAAARHVAKGWGRSGAGLADAIRALPVPGEKEEGT